MYILERKMERKNNFYKLCTMMKAKQVKNINIKYSKYLDI